MQFSDFVDGGAVLFFILFSAGFLIGISLGSFAAALIWRLPRRLPWIYDIRNKQPIRSMCPSCGTVLKPWDLVPVFSWLFLRGKCRYCSTSISPVYPLVEIFWGCVTGCVFVIFGLAPTSFFLSFILLFLGLFVWTGIVSHYWSGTIFAIVLSLVVIWGIVIFFFDKIVYFTGF